MPSDRSPLRRLGAALVEFGPHGDAHWIALRAGVSIGAPLLGLWSLGRLDLALPAAFGAFTALYGRAQGHRARAAMQATAALVLVTCVAAGTTLAALDAGPWTVAAALAVTTVIAMLASIGWAWHPPGALFPVFAVGATAGAGGDDVLAHTAVAAAVAAFSIAVGALGAVTPARHRPRQPWRTPGAIALRSPMTVEEVGRVTLAVGLTAAVATALGLGHAYWAAVAAAAATSGPTAGHRVIRGAHRAVGTILGVLAAAALLSLDLSALSTIAVVIGLQVLAELLVGRNYAVALIAITPLALLMVHLGSAVSSRALLADRLVDTLLGVAIGLAVVLAWQRHAGGSGSASTGPTAGS